MKAEIINKIKDIREKRRKEIYDRPALHITQPEPPRSVEKPREEPTNHSRIIIIDLV